MKQIENRGLVLVVGGTGYLGGQVVTRLIEHGKPVRALARPTATTTRLGEQGVQLARGDLLDLDSLVKAMDGVDAVITTAAGYTRHSKGDGADIDTVGNANLAQAAATVGVRRFVLTSILTCDQTPQIPHFWHKKLAEDRLEQLGVPFVALRPGGFLDQVSQLGGDQFAKRRLTSVGSPAVPATLVLTSDLAGYLAAAVDAPAADGERIDIGWDRPMSFDDIAATATDLLGERVRVRAVPVGAVRVAGALLGRFNPTVKDLAAMFRYFQSGAYVADTTRQAQLFGAPPSARDAVARLLGDLGHLGQGPRPASRGKGGGGRRISAPRRRSAEMTAPAPDQG